MKSISKTPEQVEFCNLMQTLENAGFYAATVAPLIRRTPGAISQYRSGKTKPSAGVLELLRRVVADKTQPNKITEKSTTTEELQNQLRDLSEKDPAGYAAAQATIEALHRRISSDGVSPRIVRIAAAAGAKHLKKFQKAATSAAASNGNIKPAIPSSRSVTNPSVAPEDHDQSKS